MRRDPRHDLLTFGLPMFVACFATLGIGLLLDWSDGALGWAFIGAALLVTAVWVLFISERPPRARR